MLCDSHVLIDLSFQLHVKLHVPHKRESSGDAAVETSTASLVFAHAPSKFTDFSHILVAAVNEHINGLYVIGFKMTAETTPQEFIRAITLPR
jgi:hypothetical protein